MKTVVKKIKHKKTVNHYDVAVVGSEAGFLKNNLKWVGVQDTFDYVMPDNSYSFTLHFVKPTRYDIVLFCSLDHTELLTLAAECTQKVANILFIQVINTTSDGLILPMMTTVDSLLFGSFRRHEMKPTVHEVAARHALFVDLRMICELETIQSFQKKEKTQEILAIHSFPKEISTMVIDYAFFKTFNPTLVEIIDVEEDTENMGCCMTLCTIC